MKRNSLLLGLIMSLLLTFFVDTPVFAASLSYGYTFTDETNATHYRFYKYTPSSGMFTLTREFYSRGGRNLYTSTGSLISSSLNGSFQKFNLYDADGNFFFITKKGETRRISAYSTKQEVVLSSGSKYFIFDQDDLGVSVVTSKGQIPLSDLKPGTPGPDDPDDPEPDDPVPPKAKNRVDKTINSYGEMVNKAYKNNSLKLTIVVSKDESKVLNQTNGVRLTDTLKGAKFCGIDSSYNVYLYELPGTLYKFTFGSWYSASKLSLSGTFKSYKVNSNGFVTAFVTTKGTYTVKDLENKNKWVAKKTYAVTKPSYVTLYIKGKTSSKTLKKSSGNLYLGKTKVSSGVTKFGFLSDKRFCFIKGGKCYTAYISKPTKVTMFVSSAKDFKRSSSNGLVNKVVLKSGKTKKIS